MLTKDKFTKIPDGSLIGSGEMAIEYALANLETEYVSAFGRVSYNTDSRAFNAGTVSNRTIRKRLSKLAGFTEPFPGIFAYKRP